MLKIIVVLTHPDCNQFVFWCNIGSWRRIVQRAAAAEDEIGSLGNNRENHAELLFRINVLTFTE